jgi:hypothetical protein
LDTVAKDEEVMERQHHRTSLRLCYFQEITGKGNDMLKMDEIGAFPSYYIQEGMVKKMIIVKDLGVSDLG